MGKDETPNDIDVLNVMNDGACKLIDYAKQQWIADKYQLGESMRQEQLAYWNRMAMRLSVLVNRFRAQIAGGNDEG